MKTALISAIALAASLFATQAAHASPSFLPVGAQANVALSTITNGGWTQCYAATMGAPIGMNAENVLNVCTGDYLMMAGRATGATTFLSLAAALRSDTIINTGVNATNTHMANGASWYFAPSWSWGFTAAGDAVNKNSCDYQNSSPLSMCLHTLSNVGGYRINDITGLNNSAAYEKVFFQASANNVPEPASLALVGLALVGLTASRKRKST